MLAFLVAAVIANAFILLRFSPLNFYKLHRYDGQLLYIKATFLGVVVTAITYLVNSYFDVIDYVASSLPAKQSSSFLTAEHLDLLFIFFLLSIFISTLYCLIERAGLWLWTFYKFRGAEGISYGQMAKIMLMYKLLKDSPLDKLLYMSYVQNRFLLMTLSDRKVYVGRVISLGEPNEYEGPDQEIAIVPVFSGYRDKDTLAVNLTTTYKETDNADEVYLVIKQANVVSACEFVESLYQKFSGKSITN
ncbi:hypothetical protein [Legionella sp. 16cNR16C]|uniref:hypothetical protein n=1 Tax=Legionella sp. 16cNR16C TaxID=2905656 RepID=UPI001E42B227|nr:hypothetical protein [Legionella sp. 16cNR16C]MCE3046284.1 hypothetical protein [Legionella sp. 16cNR16C]